MTAPQEYTYAAPVMVALARMLHDAGLVQYNATGGYTENPNRPAVTFGRLPDKPLTAVCIAVYNESRADDDGNPDVYVQLRFRAGGSPLATERLADSVFARLHWSDNHPREIWPGDVVVLLSRRTVRAPLAVDGNDRYERADSYRIHVNPGG